MKNTLTRALIAIVFTFAVTSTYAQTNYATQKCFIISDIHFDPLSGAHNDTLLYKKLQTASVEEWKKSFESSASQMTVNTTLLGKDANYGILKSALANMKRRLPNPAFIVIAGDFIWHGAKPKDSILKKKTLQFIAQLFKDNFPTVTLIPAMGNNDTYGNDYELQDAKFLNDFADAWSPALPKSATAELKSQGYYTVKKDKVKFIVINGASLAYGSQYQEQADAQLTWLQTALANPETKNVWIISHIPVGLNGYNNKNMWNVDNAQTYVNSVVANSAKVKFGIASHTHLNEFKVFYDKSGKPVTYMRVVPSICSNHYNNPSFEVAEFNSNSGEVVGETNYYLNLSIIPKDKSVDNPEWNDTFSIPSFFNTGKLNADSFSKLISDIKAGNSGQKLKDYVNFYNVGATPDSSKTINHGNYLNYLRADSLKAN
jgi:sphingomyelin phosphodiesterase acid-like 3